MSDDAKTAGQKFLENLAAKNTSGMLFQSISFQAETYKNAPPPISILLGLAKEQFSDIANSSMQALDEYGESSKEWVQFKWRLWAFLEIQDIFDAIFYNAPDEDLYFFKQWYFYYESKYILIEALLTGFNGFYQAAHTLMRPFLEFSVLQNYFYLHAKKTNSFNDLANCLKTGIRPRWSTVTRGALPNSDFASPIRGRIVNHYDSLSENFIHAYHGDFSPKTINGTNLHGHSVNGLMTFWQFIDVILEAVLWMYYVNFPMLLQPKDIIRKFGFNGPVGVFIDESCSHVFKNAISPKDLGLFQEFSDMHEDVESLKNWFDNLKDLTAEEIVATWNSKEDGEFPKEMAMAKLKRIAKIRALRETLSSKSLLPKKDEEDFADLDISLEAWKRYFSKKKKG